MQTMWSNIFSCCLIWQITRKPDRGCTVHFSETADCSALRCSTMERGGPPPGIRFKILSSRQSLDLNGWGQILGLSSLYQHQILPESAKRVSSMSSVFCVCNWFERWLQLSWHAHCTHDVIVYFQYFLLVDLKHGHRQETWFICIIVPSSFGGKQLLFLCRSVKL